MPRRSFNLSFGSVEECYVAAVEAALRRLWAAVERERADAADEWAHQVSAAIVGFLRFIDGDRSTAWMCVVAPLGGSARAAEARQRTMDRFVALVRSGPEPDEPRERPRLRSGSSAIGGLWELARQYLSDPAGDLRIDELAGSSIFLALTPSLRREEAMRHAFRVAV
ncbi:MAG: hypothetical protein ITG02_13915 [Patulibacter sp.]|nr:hypothetical protein [Patulibacter sp.]